MKKFKLILADPFIMKKIKKFTKFPTAEVFDRANADNILKFL